MQSGRRLLCAALAVAACASLSEAVGITGCVRLRYLGQDAGVAMNVSYGDSLLHSEVVKDSSPSQTCMDILSSLAQVCARFSSLGPMQADAEAGPVVQGEATETVKRGCLQLEPNLLGEVQASYSVGCFRMTPQSMTLEPQATVPAATTPNEGEGASTTETPTTPTDISAESLIAAVSETAEKGIDLLTNWLGLALEEDNNSTSTSTATNEGQEAPSTVAPSEQAEAGGVRGARRGWTTLV